MDAGKSDLLAALYSGAGYGYAARAPRAGRVR